MRPPNYREVEYDARTDCRAGSGIDGVSGFLQGLLRRTPCTGPLRRLLPRIAVTFVEDMPVEVDAVAQGMTHLFQDDGRLGAVRQDDLEEARQVQSAVLNGDPTDPLLTHFGQNGPSSGQPAREASSQVPREQ